MLFDGGGSLGLQAMWLQGEATHGASRLAPELVMVKWGYLWCLKWQITSAALSFPRASLSQGRCGCLAARQRIAALVVGLEGTCAYKPESGRPATSRKKGPR